MPETGSHGAGVPEAGDIVKCRKSERIRSLFFGPVGSLKSSRSGLRHLAAGRGNPCPGESNVRLANGHTRGGDIVGFCEGGVCGREVASKSCGTGEPRQTQREEAECTGGP